MNTRPYIGELSPEASEPIPGRRFCIARDVPLEWDELGRDHVTQYLHSDGYWRAWCWKRHTKKHGYYTREEAEEMLRSITHENEV